MTLTQLIAQYGYAAILVGAFLEGETVLLLAGFAAHQGYFSFPLVVVFALSGATLGDQLYFFIGRRYGDRLLRRFPNLTPSAQRVNRLLLRYHASVIVGVRFMYGLRVVGPIAIGMSELPAWRFVLFNLLGAAIWAPLIAGAGFMFGQTLQWLFADIKHYEEVALLVIVVIGIAINLLRKLLHMGR
ncbi:DedA family protein [Pseudomonas sp. SA3-5]|uniref:DedA family protein n=1 Tax=Pseudomonas aestuarii TaxID=3018340 RepID=A0ABT4XDS6_9PSED|nr:DedA family protein [Pseudomonas aestuarii]MDA7086334.1 DedA family protein [Pseudomonas aestuarii]